MKDKLDYRKVDKNIYFDERCKEKPYCVGIMRNGVRFTQSYQTLQEAKAAREGFLDRMISKDRPVVKLTDKTSKLAIIREVKDALKVAGYDKLYINGYIYEASEGDIDMCLKVTKMYVAII